MAMAPALIFFEKLPSTIIGMRPAFAADEARLADVP